MKRTTTWLSLALVMVLLLAALGPAVSVNFRAAALDKAAIQKILPAVVQIWWLTEQKGSLYGAGMGSGTIISADGLILTNAHVAYPDEPGIAYLGVALTVKSDRPPQPSFIAEIVAGDRNLDLAVLRITRKLDKSAIDPASLNLPFVPLGDSDIIEVGDELDIFGYPGIGGDTVTFTKGVVSGFSVEARIDGRAWIKTDTTIAGGNSGGTGVDEKGVLIGVPTRAGAGTGDSYVDCRPVADTNRDGKIDDNDTCVPIGGFINALRPINLAKPLIEAARLGLNPQSTTPTDPGSKPSGKGSIDNLLFSSGVTESSQPTAIITSLPAGSSELYLFFDYTNLAAGSTLEVKVQINGKDQPNLAWASGPWSGGPSGTWWVGWTEATLIEGTFKALIYIDGAQAAGAQLTIGGRAQATASFGNVLFSEEATAQDEPLDPGVLFPAGITRLLAFFDYENMASGTPWTVAWSLDGNTLLSTNYTWSEGRKGRYMIELTSGGGLPVGTWRLELSIQNKLAAVGNFQVTGGRGKGIVFAPFTFAEGIDRQDRPVGAARSFASGLEELYAVSDYSGMEDGLNVTVVWTLDGNKILETPYAWEAGETGTWWESLYSNSGALPDGEYGIELTVEGQAVQSGSVTVGTGPRPQPTPTPPAVDGVQVQGTIVDLDSGAPIAGAVFLVLLPGITFDTFGWTEAELYTQAQADRAGFFELPDLLERGECYTMIMGAKDYWTYAEDDVCVTDRTPDILELDVQLEKK